MYNGAVSLSRSQSAVLLHFVSDIVEIYYSTNIIYYYCGRLFLSLWDFFRSFVSFEQVFHSIVVFADVFRISNKNRR